MKVIQGKDVRLKWSEINGRNRVLKFFVSGQSTRLS